MESDEEVQVCPNCGKPLKYTTERYMRPLKFKIVLCVECGKSVRLALIESPASDGETAVCCNCNFDMPLGSTQCENCGAKLLSTRPVSVWQTVLTATLIPVVGFGILAATQSQIQKSKMTGYDLVTTFADGWMIFIPFFGIPIILFLAYLLIEKKYPDVALGMKIGLIIHLLNPLSLCLGWLGCIAMDRAK